MSKVSVIYQREIKATRNALPQMDRRHKKHRKKRPDAKGTRPWVVASLSRSLSPTAKRHSRLLMMIYSQSFSRNFDQAKTRVGGLKFKLLDVKEVLLQKVEIAVTIERVTIFNAPACNGLQCFLYTSEAPTAWFARDSNTRDNSLSLLHLHYLDGATCTHGTVCLEMVFGYKHSEIGTGIEIAVSTAPSADTKDVRNSFRGHAGGVASER
ncbi:hypothetical protein EVAR_54531_1 [Eumeta japonica]|uniref:Uncharacterized protein n=1 Tax=Eumeta variegata TaxID=151549 RepID=A0A4C1YH89_EUMVA|nr:hypothetical protein EVAR_54531_1 [Eumeta japonica]